MKDESNESGFVLLECENDLDEVECGLNANESSVCVKNAIEKQNEPVQVVKPSENFVSSDTLHLSSVDSRLGGFLSNFQNNGTVNIHFHFNEKN